MGLTEGDACLIELDLLSLMKNVGSHSGKLGSLSKGCRIPSSDQNVPQSKTRMAEKRRSSKVEGTVDLIVHCRTEYGFQCNLFLPGTKNV